MAGRREQRLQGDNVCLGGLLSRGELRELLAACIWWKKQLAEDRESLHPPPSDRLESDLLMHSLIKAREKSLVGIYRFGAGCEWLRPGALHHHGDQPLLVDRLLLVCEDQVINPGQQIAQRPVRIRPWEASDLLEPLLGLRHFAGADSPFTAAPNAM